MSHISAIDDEPEIGEAELPTDVGDAKQVKAKIKKAKNLEEVRRDTLKGFLSTAEGRAWFYGLLADCGVFRNPFTQDPAVTSFNCGEMNVGQKVLAAVVDASPDAYLQMLKEQKDA